MHEEKELDLLDRRLIYELDRDSRQAVTKIARKLRISSQKAEYRIGQLEKKGVILGYPAIIDYKKLGYSWYALVIKTRPIPTRKKAEIISKILANPNTLTFFEGEGRWNFYYGTLATDVVIADASISQVHELLKDYVMESHLLIHTGAYYYGRKYLYDPADFEGAYGDAARDAKWDTEFKEVSYGQQISKAKTDVTDMKILQWLSSNSRISTIELAKRIKSTPDIVRYRIKNLIKSGLLKKFTVLLDPGKTGYSLVRIFIRLHFHTKAKRDEIRSFLHKYPVFRIISMVGRYEMLMDVLVTHDDELRQLLDDLIDSFPDAIVERETMRIRRIWRSNYFFTP
jgi:Lrp/AsnC family transcriptional regulator for asnA, asnC and gidA